MPRDCGGRGGNSSRHRLGDHAAIDLEKTEEHVLDRGRPRLDLADNAAATHQIGAVREADHLLDLRRDEEDRGAAGRELDDEIMDAPTRADVDAARGLVEEDDSWPAEHPFREEHLLLV